MASFRPAASRSQRVAGKGNKLGSTVSKSTPGEIEIPTSNQPEELVYLMRCYPYISRYPADCLEDLNILFRLAQSKLREYLLDVHVGLAEICEADLFEEVTGQREPYPLYLVGDFGCYLYAPLLIRIKRFDPGVECPYIRKPREKGSPRGDRPAKAPPQAARVVVEFATWRQLLSNVIEQPLAAFLTRRVFLRDRRRVEVEKDHAQPL
jgi:hypothetical protein